MPNKNLQDELSQSLFAIKKHWDEQGVQAPEEYSQLERALQQLSINELNAIKQSLTVEVNCEEKELQAETHGGTVYARDELERINELAYRLELASWLEQVLESVKE